MICCLVPFLALVLHVYDHVCDRSQSPRIETEFGRAHDQPTHKGMASPRSVYYSGLRPAGISPRNALSRAALPRVPAITPETPGIEGWQGHVRNTNVRSLMNIERRQRDVLHGFVKPETAGAAVGLASPRSSFVGVHATARQEMGSNVKAPKISPRPPQAPPIPTIPGSGVLSEAKHWRSH